MSNYRDNSSFTSNNPPTNSGSQKLNANTNEKSSETTREEKSLRPKISEKSDSNSKRKNIHSNNEPHMVGQYQIIKTIGKGNFAKVKLAQHTITKRNVAIKIMDKVKMNPSGLHKLMREVRIMKMLDHPNIVKLYEVMESETTLYLVIEYCEGGEVFDYLVTHGRMKEKEARDKFRQILSAVQYCHRMFVIHRDLKAENLLLDSSLNVKIADFGFSNQYHPERKLETFCGSPPYAAPELFLGQKYVGPEVDIWSLGVILFTLVSGSLPFDGQNIKELRGKVLKGEYRVPFYMSTTCENLIKRMLVIDSQKRITLDNVMDDLWVNEGMMPLKPYQVPPYNYDEDRFSAMLAFGFSNEEITRSLREKRYDPVMATYMLLDTKQVGPEEYMRTNILESTSIDNDFQDSQSFLVNPSSNTTKINIRPRLTNQRKPIVGDNYPKQQFADLKQSPYDNRRNTIQLDSKFYQNQNSSKIPSPNRHSMISPHKMPILNSKSLPSGATTSIMKSNHHSNCCSPESGVDYHECSSPASNTKCKKGIMERITRHLRKSSFVGRNSTSPSSSTSPGGFHEKSPAIATKSGGGYRFNENNPPDSLKSSFGESTVTGFSENNPSSEPRSLRFTWNFRTTSTKPATEIMHEIQRVLTLFKIEYQQIDNFTYQCYCDFSREYNLPESASSEGGARRLSLDSTKNRTYPVNDKNSGGSNATSKILNHKEIQFDNRNNMAYASNRTVQWEIEICRLPLLFMNAVRFKRISGETFLYKSVVSNLTDEMIL